MFFVYCLRSTINNQLYIGFTSNLERRFKEHNSGKNRSTKAYAPYILLFSEKIETRLEARAREKYLKSGIGREFINKNWPNSTNKTGNS